MPNSDRSANPGKLTANLSEAELAAVLAARPDLITAPDFHAAQHRAASALSVQLAQRESGPEQHAAHFPGPFLQPPFTFGTAAKNTREHAVKSAQKNAQETVQKNTEHIDDDAGLATLVRNQTVTAAGVQAINHMHQLMHVLAPEAQSGIPELRSGGLGVTRIKTWASAAGLSTQHTVFLMESAAQLGLIFPARGQWWLGNADHRHTVQVSTNLWARWVNTWLVSTRTWADIPVLHPAGASSGAPRERTQLLKALSEAQAQAPVSEVPVPQRFLTWRFPNFPAEVIQRFLDQAGYLGLLVAERITEPARLVLESVLKGEPASHHPVLSQAQKAMNFPPATEKFRILSDHTVVVAGPPIPELVQLEELADVVSRGAATVYRISEASLQRSRWSRAQVKRFLTTYAEGKIPETLHHLVDNLEPGATAAAAPARRPRAPKRARESLARLTPTAFPPIGTEPEIEQAVARLQSNAQQTATLISPVQFIRENMGTPLRISWVDAHGQPEDRTLIPTQVHAGQLTATDPGTGSTVVLGLPRLLDARLETTEAMSPTGSTATPQLPGQSVRP